MKQLTVADIRSSFVNATRGEIERMPLPGLHEVIWESREYLGWRDTGAPLRGYLVHWRDDKPIGIVLRATEASLRPGISAMCTLCRTAQPSSQVTLFSAPRAGESGRNGNSIGTYICDDLACSIIIRILPPAQPMQPDPAEILEARMTGLLNRVQAFTADVMKTA
jgi:hypothetical protein